MINCRDCIHYKVCESPGVEGSDIRENGCWDYLDKSNLRDPTGVENLDQETAVELFHEISDNHKDNHKVAFYWPCNIGDKLYWFSNEKNRIISGTVTFITAQYTGEETFFTLSVEAKDGTHIFNNEDMYDTIFPDKETAKKALL